MAALPFKVKAVFEYVSEHEDDLNFPVGQIITVTELEGDDWYVGEYVDATGANKNGLFPSNFVEKYEPEIPMRPTRPARPKQDVQPTPAPAPPVEPEEPSVEDEAPPVPALSKPTAAAPEEARSPPPAPKLTPAEPAEPTAAPAAKKAPPPVAVKSNAFKDRIAAFNQSAAPPIAPVQPGRKPQASDFIKKPFVAPPPSKNAYVPPPPKVEAVQKHYNREEDPEIKQRQEEDRAAAEAAGFTNEPSTTAPDEEDEDAPKPMTLKERMARLQQQQLEQAQRRADASQKKKPPVKQASQSEQAPVTDDGDEAEPRRSEGFERRSLEKPRVPSERRPPEPIAVSPEHELLSDGHEADQSGAGEMTEDDTGTLGPDESEENVDTVRRRGTGIEAQPEMGEEGDAADRDDEEEEDSMDEEERRKQELRARMARLGGAQAGMGAMGMPFNPFGPQQVAPPKKRSAGKDAKETKTGDEIEQSGPSEPQQRVPMIPVPGIPRMQSPESDTTQRIGQEVAQEPDEDEEAPPSPPKRTSTSERVAPPPVPKADQQYLESRPLPPPPQERAAAPPVPSGTARPPPPPESRPVPPPPPPVMSPGPGSESDDEMSMHARRSSAEMSGADTPLPIRSVPPPIPGSRELPPRPPQSPENKRTSYFSSSEPPSATSDKRSSRAVPPVPGSPPASSRPPPPPPPHGAPGRQSTMDEPSAHDEDERVSSEYDGDYDTDIASSAKHKEALKAPHDREASLTDSPIMTDDTSVITPVPPPPQSSAPRAVPPPPPPTQSAPKTRPSMDRPPPPVPPPREEDMDEEYDPYRYPAANRAVPPPPNTAPVAALPMVQEPEPMHEESSADDMYEQPAPPNRRSTDRAPPMPQSRQSLDVNKSAALNRRSIEQGRPSGEHDQIAGDIDLNTSTPWWTAAQPLPPSLQSRNGVDLLSECEETSKSKRGGRKEITKDIYVLFMDYSQTVISARYDSQDASEVHFEQRHEPPPPKLRQDQLEAAWQRFGKGIGAAATAAGSSKKDTIVGDGTPASLPLALIKAADPNALLPVGTRAYGALVYANLANASTLQYDEIRPGDVLTLRNAKFEGHHGAMKTKYKADYGPAHVAVVAEWDGTRRAVRAWEQGRDKKPAVRSEKFRLADLRSGEVRVWRVVGRDWVGWES